MKQIPLTRGLFAIVDDEDFERVSQFKWQATGDERRRYYATHGYYVNGKTKHLYMHRFIMDEPAGMQVDHINGNSLDNRRCNLRVATRQQNRHNSRLNKNSGTGFTGVTELKGKQARKSRFRAYIIHNNKNELIGHFACPIEAAKAYDRRARELRGEFARTNF
jgi:hypothetical protein